MKVNIKLITRTSAYFVREIENRILEQVDFYCVDKKVIKYRMCSLCYDGIMILKRKLLPGTA